MEAQKTSYAYREGGKIILIHPITGERHSIAEWQRITGHKNLYKLLKPLRRHWFINKKRIISILNSKPSKNTAAQVNSQLENNDKSMRTLSPYRDYVRKSK